MHFSQLTGAALAAAIVAAGAVLGFARLPGLFVWAAFIGWASYDHSGATLQAALRSAAALTFGVAMAWFVAIVVASGALPLDITPATAVVAGLASFLIVMASRWSYLGIVPATFYGFASTFAYLSLVPGAFTTAALTAPGWNNAIFSVTASLLIGTGLGIVHGWLASLVTARASAGLTRTREA